jgi:benzoylformate decarboxylase
MAGETVRDAVFRLFREFGMTTIFGNPGSTELPMFRDFPADFRYVLGLQESIAVGMADGFAQATGNAAVINLHSAVGVGHAMGNIFTAYRNRTPLVIVAGQQARSILPYEPFLFSLQATELPKPYVKWSGEPARAADVPAAIARAYYTAMQPPTGPVLVSVPVDDWEAGAAPIEARQVSRRLAPDPNSLADLGEALDAAARPVIVVGAAVDRNGAFDLAVRLAERHGAPVWAAPMSSRCSFPEDHPLFAGFLVAGRERIVAALGGHDLVLVLGAPVFTYHTEGFGPHVPIGARLFQITDDPETAAWAPVGSAVVASLDLAIEALLGRAAPPERARGKGRGAVARVAAAAPISAEYLMQTLAEIRPAGSIVVEEAPSSRAALHGHLPITRARSFFTCASGGLGYSLPASVGVALARRDKRVVALLGDGSAMYSIQALWTAARHGLPLTVVIVNNGRYAALDEFARHFQIPQPVGTTLGGIGFVDVARGLGCAGEQVERAEDLAAALDRALGAPGPSLLDVVVG